MAEFQIDKILISVLVVTGLFATLGIYFADLNDKYTVNGYYEQNLSSYTNTFNEIQDDSEQISGSVELLSSGNLLDILGGLKQGGINLIKIFFDSFTSIGFMFIQSIDVFDLGPAGTIWGAIATVAVVIVFVVVFLIKKLTN